ncbi:MAG: STAS/SEC14 domain-containing protein [Psychromonas sp.]
MLKVELDVFKHIAILEPIGELSKNDFIEVTEIIDPYIEKTGKLKGLIIQVRSFHGWDSFAALIAHLTFVKDHHKKVSHIAFVTDSRIGKMAESIAAHFVNAKIKNFKFDELDSAKTWILSND